MALTEAEVDAVRLALAETTDFRVFPLLVETILWAIFTVLISMASYTLLSRRQPRSKIMLALILVMYGFATLDWAIDVRRVWTDLKISIPAELSSPLHNESVLNTENTVLHIIQSTTNNISVAIGGIIICWRVCVVYVWKKRVIAIAIFLWLATAITAFTCNLTQIAVALPNAIHLRPLASSQLAIGSIALAFSSIMNIWATGMIAVRAWQSRREIRRHFANSDPKSFTESVLTLFVETGAVYTALWILKNVMIIPQVTTTPYMNYADVVMDIAVGLYPTLILIVVALQRSHLEHQFSYCDGKVETLRFAPTTSSKLDLHSVDTVGGEANVLVSVQLGQCTDTPSESNSSFKTVDKHTRTSV